MSNSTNPKSTGLPSSAVFHAKQILREVASDTTSLLYANLDLDRSLPVLTGYSGTKAAFVAALPQGSADTDNALTVDRLRGLLCAYDCDTAAVTYPVNIEQLDAESADHTLPHSGLLIDVQTRNGAGSRGIVPLVGCVGGHNTFGPILPVLNGNYAIAYPGLLESVSE